MLDAFRRHETNTPEASAERRWEGREKVIDGCAEIEGRVYPLKNWSPNGFCIGPTDLAPKPGDRLVISFTIPLQNRNVYFRCRTAVMRFDEENQEIGGVFLDLPDGMLVEVDRRFDVKAPKGYGRALLKKLRMAIGESTKGGEPDVLTALDRTEDEEETAASEDEPDISGDLTVTDDNMTDEGAEAEPWYRQAAEGGCADSQALLGLSYTAGEGVPQDYVQAKMWLSLAAAQGHEEAIRGRDMIAKHMTPEQTAEAERLVHQWLERHP